MTGPRALEPIAGQILRKLELDPVTIILVVQAIIALLRLVQECRANKAWPGIRSRVGSRWVRRRCRRAIVEAMGEEDFAKAGEEELVLEILRRSEEFSDDEIYELIGCCLP